MDAESIKMVVVVGGGGAIGEGIVQSFAQAGLSVRVVDVGKEQLDRCLAQVDANLRLFQEFGLLEEDPSSVVSRIQPVLSQDLAGALKDCDFVVETVPEDLELKRQVFAQLDSCRDEAILSSNTSSFTVSDFAKGCRTMGRIIGLHYFNPAHTIPLVEIHRGPQTRDEVIDITKAFMLRVGKKPVIVRKEICGFIVNRIQAAIAREMHYLIDQGVTTPEDIDVAMKASVGFRHACIGPMEFVDIGGMQTALAASKLIYKELCNSTEPSRTVVGKVQSGEVGIRGGRGWYDWTGRSRGEILDDYNRRLLKQFALYKSIDKHLPLYKLIEESDK